MHIHSKKIHKIALTGGMGCGKSEALKIFGENHFKTVDCDALVHVILDQNTDIQSNLVMRWGKEVLKEDGRVDRAKLANIVFKKNADLAYLESILHPKVRERWEDIIADHQNDQDQWVVEIPLLFEKKLEKYFDLSVCIYASEDVQKHRMKSRGISEEMAELRIQNQMPLTEKVTLADFVILNDGSESFLRQQISRLVHFIS